MPRNTLISLSALLLLVSLPATAKPGSCDARVQAFNEYEELSEGKIVEKVSLFKVGEWSPDSAFEGLLVRADEDPATKLEIEAQVAKTKKKLKKDFTTKAWGERKDYRVVENFNNGKDVLGTKFEAGTYVLKLTLNGKVLCEDAPRKISPSGD